MPRSQRRHKLDRLRRKALQLKWHGKHGHKWTWPITMKDPTGIHLTADKGKPVETGRHWVEAPSHTHEWIRDSFHSPHTRLVVRQKPKFGRISLVRTHKILGVSESVGKAWDRGKDWGINGLPGADVGTGLVAITPPPFGLGGGGKGRFSGRTASPELKWFDTTVNFRGIPLNGSQKDSVNLIPQGVTENTRVGRRCTIRSIHWRMTLHLSNVHDSPTATPSEVYRIIMYLDKQCNGAAIIVRDLLEDNFLNQYRNLANTRRFSILYDGHKVVLLDDFAGASSHMTLTFLLRLLDRYPVMVPTKGSHTWWHPDHIYVTTNILPALWYKWENRGEHYRALARRFHKVILYYAPLSGDDLGFVEQEDSWWKENAPDEARILYSQ